MWYDEEVRYITDRRSRMTHSGPSPELAAANFFKNPCDRRIVWPQLVPAAYLLMHHRRPPCSFPWRAAGIV